MSENGLKHLYTFNKFHEQHPWLGSKSSLRWCLFHRESNGLSASGAVIKVGQRRLLIDAVKFEAWLRAQSEAD